MRIAYIGKFDHLYDEQGIALTFEALGHTVYRFSEESFTGENITEILDLKPNILLFAKLRIDVNLRPVLIKNCRKKNITTVCWVPDLYFGLIREHKVRQRDLIFRADHVFTPDGGHDKEWKELGINHHLLRQGIYEPECYIGERTERPYTIAFIGSQNGEFPYRTKLIEHLKDRYEDFIWFGKRSPVEIRGGRLNDLFASVPIVIGDSVYSPRYWSNRIYETIGRGGFIIHPMIDGLDEDFIPYKHFIPYNYGDFTGLFEKIDYFLKNEPKRQEVSMAGFEHVKKNHTLTQRCVQLINSL